MKIPQPEALECARRIRPATGAVLLLAVALGACTTKPADYAARLSPQDPKWQSVECHEIRAAAASYQGSQTIDLHTGLLLGPYGLGIALAGKEHQEKKRRAFAREIHLRCSSLPVPKSLEFREP